MEREGHNAAMETGYKVEPSFKDIPMHVWYLKGPKGGVHVWARQTFLEGFAPDWIGGIEVHWFDCPNGGWFNSEQPSQDECWLLKGPCWHDGSSLYFNERIEHHLPRPWDEKANEFERMPTSMIYGILREWYAAKIDGEAS